ncbi:MAG: hypothetical protein U0487_03035 [Patescibacteria group bacterium]
MTGIDIVSEQEAIIDHESVGVIITCPKLGAFMFQLNGDEHPDPRCRGKYQLWGGRMEPQDRGNPFEALRRELYEEWRDHRVADAVLTSIGPRQRPKIFTPWSSGGTHQPYRYRLYTFLALANQDRYMDWFTSLEAAGYNEGRLTVMDRKCVELHIDDVEKSKLFLGSQNEVLREYFTLDEALRY